MVKGVRFRDHRDMGGILELAGRYRDEGADELVFYDITASPGGRSVDRSWVTRVAELLDIPFCVAGGIRDLATAEGVLADGADKISINTPALEDPSLIDALARRFGSQCVVIGIDSRREPAGEGAGWQGAVGIAVCVVLGLAVRGRGGGGPATPATPTAPATGGTPPSTGCAKCRTAGLARLC